MTILVNHECPRHNTTATRFQDYNSLVSPHQNETYFENLGGYNAFWAFLNIHSPELYEALDGENAATPSMISEGIMNLASLEGNQPGAFESIKNNYAYDIIEIWVRSGKEIPPNLAAGFAQEKERRRKSGTMKGWEKLSYRDQDFFDQEMAKSPMIKELKEVLAGKWNGVPHWTIEG